MEHPAGWVAGRCSIKTSWERFYELHSRTSIPSTTLIGAARTMNGGIVGPWTRRYANDLQCMHIDPLDCLVDQ